jgi:hypothetical protein
LKGGKQRRKIERERETERDLYGWLFDLGKEQCAAR